MGKVIASCGHELTEQEGFGTQIYTKGSTRECEPAIDYHSVCNKCLDWYQKEDAIMTHDEAYAWLESNEP